MELIPTIIQDVATGEVLTLAYSNEESLAKTRETGETWLWSRKRGLWHKGETSGNTQKVINISQDCDGDALLFQVAPSGPACHNGGRFCFAHDFGGVLSYLDETIDDKYVKRPFGSLTTQLSSDRNKLVKKLGEEYAEMLVAFASFRPKDLVHEVADLMYLLGVALRCRDVGFREVLAQLHLRSFRDPDLPLKD